MTIVKNIFMSAGAYPAPFTVGFPKATCISINEEVCHGICSKQQILREGDVVSIDISLGYKGYFSDSCFTYIIGNSDLKTQKLVKGAYEIMWGVINKIKANITVSTLSKLTEKLTKIYKYNTVKEFSGHGIGTALHMKPYIPFRGKHPGIIKENTFITIEPMINQGGSQIIFVDNGWTAITKDKKKSAQFEHTIWVKKNGFEVLTYNNFDKQNHKPRVI